jgi:hypothetical protein
MGIQAAHVSPRISQLLKLNEFAIRQGGLSAPHVIKITFRPLGHNQPQKWPPVYVRRRDSHRRVNTGKTIVENMNQLDFGSFVQELTELLSAIGMRDTDKR